MMAEKMSGTPSAIEQFSFAAAEPGGCYIIEDTMQKNYYHNRVNIANMSAIIEDGTIIEVSFTSIEKVVFMAYNNFKIILIKSTIQKLFL